MFTYAGLLVLFRAAAKGYFEIVEKCRSLFPKAEGDTVPLLTLSAQQFKTQRYSVDHVRPKKSRKSLQLRSWISVMLGHFCLKNYLND